MRHFARYIHDRDATVLQRLDKCLGAVRALDDSGLIDTVWSDSTRAARVQSFAQSYTIEARGHTGAWPPPDFVSDDLRATFKNIDEQSGYEGIESKALRAAYASGSLTRDPLVRVLGRAAGVSPQ